MKLICECDTENEHKLNASFGEYGELTSLGYVCNIDCKYVNEDIEKGEAEVITTTKKCVVVKYV